MKIFVAQPFGEPWSANLLDCIRKIAEEYNFLAVRGASGAEAYGFSDKIQQEIEQCTIFVADLTGNNPNVIDEVGQARALKKTMILLTQNQSTVPANLRHLKNHEYTHNNFQNVEKSLKEVIRDILGIDYSLLRSMLIPDSLGYRNEDSQFVIAASPLSFHRAFGRPATLEDRMRPTYSDYVGIRNILQSFGILFGFGFLPDLIHPDDFADKALENKMNLYCIASPKANRWTGKLIDKLNDKWNFGLSFRADPASRDLKNVLLSICKDGKELYPEGDITPFSDRQTADFGIIVRAPNPFAEKYMVALLAGRSSLGTEAACMAFTNPTIIKKIWDLMITKKLDLNNHENAFFALVSLHRKETKINQDTVYLTDPETLRVHDVYPL